MKVMNSKFLLVAAMLAAGSLGACSSASSTEATVSGGESGGGGDVRLSTPAQVEAAIKSVYEADIAGSTIDDAFEALEWRLEEVQEPVIKRMLGAMFDATGNPAPDFNESPIFKTL
jgi:hypothetical protein